MSERDEALALAERGGEAFDLLLDAIQSGDVPDEVLSQLLPDLRVLAEAAERALATAEGPCVARGRSFFPTARHRQARRGAGAEAELPGATKSAHPDPRPAPGPGCGGRPG
jgi:hypothetical protein